MQILNKFYALVCNLDWVIAATNLMQPPITNKLPTNDNYTLLALLLSKYLIRLRTTMLQFMRLRSARFISLFISP